jgi:hypothetical protein
MAVERQAHMADHRVRPAFRHQVDGLAEINEARDGPIGHAVIHRYDDGFFRITVHDSFQTNFLSSHNNNNLPLRSLTNLLCKPEGLINTSNKTGNKS